MYRKHLQTSPTLNRQSGGHLSSVFSGWSPPQAQGTGKDRRMPKIHNLKRSQERLQLHRDISPWFHWYHLLSEWLLSRRAPETNIHLLANSKPWYLHNCLLVAVEQPCAHTVCNLLFYVLLLIQWSLTPLRSWSCKQVWTCSWDYAGIVLLARFLNAA